MVSDICDSEILIPLADILKVAIETPPYDYIIKIMNAIGRNDVEITLDTGHTFFEGDDQLEELYVGKP